MNKISQARTYFRELHQRQASRLLMILLALDILFIVLHYLNEYTNWLDHPRLSIEKDKGYAEYFQYFKLIAIIFLFTSFAIKTRVFQYLAWACFFGYLFIDDAFQFHERAGKHLIKPFEINPPFGLRPLDIGELGVSVIAGLFLFILLGWTYRYGSRAFRMISLDIGILIAVLVFFGVFVDMLHIAIQRGDQVTFTIGVIEDGGEMITISAMVWYTFLMTRFRENARCYLNDFIRLPFASKQFSRNSPT